jgi:HPt (histidine-containing phosphotransfer) domain-containing protein
MDNAFSPLDDLDNSELLDDDLAILQAFKAMENWPPAPRETASSQSASCGFVVPSTSLTPSDDEDILKIFIAEAEDDIANMLQIVKHLEQDDHTNLAQFVRLQRLGHKLRGTAGAIDFPVMSTIASNVEKIAEQVTKQKLKPVASLYTLSQAVTALERYLREIISRGKEPEGDALLAAFHTAYRNLDIDAQLFPET